MRSESLKNCRNIFLWCVLSAFAWSSCGSDGFQHAKVTGDSRTGARVLYDSPNIQRLVKQVLLAKEEHRKGMASPDKSTALATFLFSRLGNLIKQTADEMGRESGFDVPGGTRFKTLFESDVLFYSKVEFESGAFKGQVGWLSRSSFDDPRTHMP